MSSRNTFNQTLLMMEQGREKNDFFTIKPENESFPTFQHRSLVSGLG